MEENKIGRQYEYCLKGWSDLYYMDWQRKSFLAGLQKMGELGWKLVCQDSDKNFIFVKEKL